MVQITSVNSDARIHKSVNYIYELRIFDWNFSLFFGCLRSESQGERVIRLKCLINEKHSTIYFTSNYLRYDGDGMKKMFIIQYRSHNLKKNAETTTIFSIKFQLTKYFLNAFIDIGGCIDFWLVCRRWYLI